MKTRISRRPFGNISKRSKSSSRSTSRKWCVGTPSQDPPLCADLEQTELHQEHLAREKRLEDQLASEKHHAQALRTQNVYLKEKVEQMLQVMKAACASDKDHAYDEEVHSALDSYQVAMSYLRIPPLCPVIGWQVY